MGQWALPLHQSLKTQQLLNTCFTSMTNMLLSLPTRSLTLSFVCVNHIYIDYFIKKLGINNSLGKLTYTPTTPTKEEILDNHRSVLCSFGISIKDEELDLPSLYWIPKLHKGPYKQRYIAGSAKCSYGCKLCSSSHRLVPLFVQGRLHTGVSQEKRKEDNPIL